MNPQSIESGGARLVGDIVGTNTLRFSPEQNGLVIAILLLSTHTPGAPVVDQKGKFVGFVSEFDILQALEAGKNLNGIMANDLMAKDRVPLTAYTTIAEAVKLMGKSRFLNLPVERNGKVIGCVTRHDLLRAWIGVGLGLDLEGKWT